MCAVKSPIYFSPSSPKLRATETLFKGMQSLLRPLWEVRKHLNAHYWFAIELMWVEDQHKLTEGIKCWGQRLIKQRGPFAPALLTNLSPVKMTAREAWNSHRPHAESPFRLLCPISSQNGMSVYRWATWRDPSKKSYGYAIMSWGLGSIFAWVFHHYI